MAHVVQGRERLAAERIKAVAGDAAHEAFALFREVPRRVAGAWRTERELAYPGYVFIAVCDPKALQERLGAVLATADIHLLMQDNEIQLLDPAQAKLVWELGGAEHVVRMSVGDIVAGQLVVREGSLVGHERYVTRVDRHRRSAWVAADSGARGVRVGLEVVSKT